MFGGLQERIGLQADGGLLLAAQERAHWIQSLSQPLQKIIKGLEGKGQTQRLRDRFNRSPPAIIGRAASRGAWRRPYGAAGSRRRKSRRCVHIRRADRDWNKKRAG